MKLQTYELTFEVSDKSEEAFLQRKLKRVIDSWNNCATVGLVDEVEQND